MTYQTLEEACESMIKLTKEWAAHPAINCNPAIVEVKFKTNIKVHGHCGKRWGKWVIGYNLHMIKANLDKPEELLLLIKHEVGHIKQQNHSKKFKEVLRQLGVPEERLQRARYTAHQLVNYTPENKFVCLRCGYTKSTQRVISNKTKVCDWCGHEWDKEKNKMDRSRTMALFPVAMVNKVKVVRSSEQVRALKLKTYNLPWQEFAEYKRDGGEFDLLTWWEAIQQMDKEVGHVNN